MPNNRVNSGGKKRPSFLALLFAARYATRYANQKDLKNEQTTIPANSC